MASEVIAFPVYLRKNKNQYNAGYGQYYPEADTKEPLSLKGFITAVLTALGATSCMGM